MQLWFNQIETLEEISQNAAARQLFLRMAQLSQAGATGAFLLELESAQIDDETRHELAELASDRQFLLGFDDYVRRTRLTH